ncbi:hypothetical protein C2E23DRAFT_706913, partial [Lenzites betulinus]
AQTPKPPREPKTAAEICVRALFEELPLGLSTSPSEENLKNITLTVAVRETPGPVDRNGFFKAMSTYDLVLTLEPGMFMRRLEVILDSFVGDEDMGSAPTWLKQISRVQGWSAQYVRQYQWMMHLIAFVTLKPGVLDDAKVPAWLELAEYIGRIKAVFDEAARPRVPPELRPRPRPRRSASMLVSPMSSLSL